MKFEIYKRDTIYDGRLFKLQRVHARMPDGRDASFDVVRHMGAVAMLPVDSDGNIWLVRQFRVAVEQVMLEIPAGTLEAGENPDDCAYRELREEIGMAAGKLEKLVTLPLAPGYSSELLHIYLATDLSPDSLEGDADEFLNIQIFPISEAYRMARQGEICDAKTLATLFLAQPYIDEKHFDR